MDECGPNTAVRDVPNEKPPWKELFPRSGIQGRVHRGENSQRPLSETRVTVHRRMKEAEPGRTKGKTKNSANAAAFGSLAAECLFLRD